MTDLNKLAEQIEQAKPEQQREMLELAFDAVFPEPPRSWKPMPIQQAIKDPDHIPALRAHSHWRHNIRGRFFPLLDLEAFVDAALMFVPERYMLYQLSDVIFEGLAGCMLTSVGKPAAVAFGGSTHAMHILAAALRAQASKGDAR